MFGWIRKKTSKGKTGSEVNALQWGKDYAQELVGLFDTFLTERFDPVRINYLELLKKFIKESLNSKDAPPSTTARIQFELFIEQVGELRSKMSEELTLFVRGMLENTIQVIPNAHSMFDELVIARVEDFLLRLKVESVNVMSDHVEPLTEADIAWRKANPTLSSKFPEHDFLESLCSLRRS
jgi:hypothetical protein